MKMPWVLKGHSTFVRNRLLKKYTLNDLRSEEIWYAEVIAAPEVDFSGVHHNEISSVYEYLSPTQDDLAEIEAKYGNTEKQTVVIELLKDLYDQAFRKAIVKLSGI